METDPSEYVADNSLGESRAVRDASFELNRLWRHGWDQPGSSGYQSYMLAYRTLTDLLPDYRGSMVQLAQAVLRSPRGDA